MASRIATRLYLTVISAFREAGELGFEPKTAGSPWHWGGVDLAFQNLSLPSVTNKSARFNIIPTLGQRSHAVYQMFTKWWLPYWLLFGRAFENRGGVRSCSRGSREALYPHDRHRQLKARRGGQNRARRTIIRWAFSPVFLYWEC